MSNELQDVVIWLLAITSVIQLANYVRLKREIRDLKAGHFKAVAIRKDRKDPPVPGGRLRRIKTWLGLVAIGELVDWISRRKVTAALVGVAVVSPAIVLLPQDAQMAPQAAPPPVTTTRTPSQHPAARGPTAPTTASETPAPSETSAPPTSTTGAPTTGAPTTTTAAPPAARPSSTPSASIVSSAPAPVSTSTAALPTVAAPPPIPDPKPDKDPKADGKPDKAKDKGKPAGAAPLVAVQVSPPHHRGLCLRLLVITLGRCDG